MSRQLRPSENCLNCGRPVATRFCAECGQENTNYRVHLGRLFGDLVEEVFQLESRLWRTLWNLVRHPGRLTVEYNAGRRVRYTTPLRLYLLCSLVYFFVGSVIPSRHDAKVRFDLDKPEQTALEKRIQSKSGWQRTVLERAAAAARDPQAAGKRAEAALSEWAPRMMAVLVPLFALLTMLFFRRPKLFYVEHLVFALHVHATAFLLLTVAELLRSPWVGLLAMLALAVCGFVAARVVFRQSWWRLAWKLPLIGLVYSILLSVGVAFAALRGVFAS